MTKMTGPWLEGAIASLGGMTLRMGMFRRKIWGILLSTGLVAGTGSACTEGGGASGDDD